MRAVVLDARAQLFADRAGSGLGGIGGAHRVPPFRYGALRFQNHEWYAR